MAIEETSGSIEGLIHHSDRDVPYCSHNYVKLLQDNQVQISMTESGDPLENALAERINGILKGEYLECSKVETIQEATSLLEKDVNLYNQERPHMSIGNLTPEEVHQSNQITERLWENYYTKNRPLVNLLLDQPKL